MSVIKINAITVSADSGDELAKRFAARAGAVDNQPGFEGFELLRPTDDRTTWLVMTRWKDEESFNAWVSSPAFMHGHKGVAPKEGEERAHVAMSSELWSYEPAFQARPERPPEPETMAHPQQRSFMERVAVLHPTNGPLLEIGSLDVNGTVRDLFPGATPYVGIDLDRGRGVDVVASGHDFGRDAAFVTVVTTECLEHDPGWHLTLRNIVRVLRPGGTLVLTCATTGRHEHGTARTSPAMSPSTNDHYRNLTAADVLAHLGGLRVDLVAMCWSSFDLYVVARKPPAPPADPTLAALAARYRRDGARPSRLADRVLLRAFRTDQMDGVPLWAGLVAHPLRALVLGVALLREADPSRRRAGP